MIKYSSKRFVPILISDTKYYIDKSEIIKIYLSNPEAFTDRILIKDSRSFIYTIVRTPYNFKVYIRKGFNMYYERNILSTDLAKLPEYESIISKFRSDYPEKFI